MSLQHTYNEIVLQKTKIKINELGMAEFKKSSIQLV